MKSRSRNIRRLAVLRALVEHSRALELVLATAAVAEVERMGSVLASLKRGQANSGVEALNQGNVENWAVARLSCKAVEMREHRLEAERGVRKTLLENALISYRAGRMEMKQMENEADRIQMQVEIEDARRTQKDLDNSYLNRRVWGSRGHASDRFE